MAGPKSRDKGSLVLVARDIRPDAKKRVTLAKAMADLEDDVRFDVYLNENGQILLDPQISIPASEAWLYRNPTAIDAVRRGLQEAAEGESVHAGSFAQYADEE